eukprot:Skav235815  [mRNA]  locus=scaffold1267:389071:389713:- [translate_table: standard]
MGEKAALAALGISEASPPPKVVETVPHFTSHAEEPGHGICRGRDHPETVALAVLLAPGAHEERCRAPEEEEARLTSLCRPAQQRTPRSSSEEPSSGFA